jgi:hypothetical protein
VTGAFLILGGFLAGWFRPPPESDAQALGRVIGQVLLMASGVVLALYDVVRSRLDRGGDGGS